MVNLRKIGAIATGALFVGATIGMAAAVTVPTAFQSSMLAQNGVAKAKLVVGNKAGGIEADRASATIIKDKAAAKLAVTGTGGQVAVKYGVQDLNDDGATNVKDKFFATGGIVLDTLDLDDSSNVQDAEYVTIGNPANATLSGMLFDANGDGDVKDSDDYRLYDGVYAVNGADGLVRFTYVLNNGDTGEQNAESDFVDGDNALEKGEVFKVKGTRYALVDTDYSAGTVDLGPALALTIGDMGSGTPEGKLARVVGYQNWRVLYQNSTDKLNFYDGEALVDSYTNATAQPEPKRLNDLIGVGALEDKYNIYVAKITDSVISLSFVDKDATVKLMDGQANVLGYSKVLVNSDDFKNASSNSKITNAIAFLSSPVQLVRDDTIDIADTYYQAKWDLGKALDIKRGKTQTQSSGAKWKSGVYPDFLTAEVTISVTGGAAVSPSLDIAEDDAVTTSDKNDFNLVLVGGPVANALTASLVQTRAADAGSLDSWKASDGDIKVVANAFTTGKYGIVVAGKNRDATKAAAQALADAL